MEKAIAIFRESCKQLGISEELPTHPNKEREKAYQARHMLEVITEAKNGEWKADFANWDQRKWTCWFVAEKNADGTLSGFRFYDAYCVYAYSHAGAGSRLYFATEELAEWSAKELIDLHNAILMP